MSGNQFKKLSDLDVSWALDEVSDDMWQEITARQDTPGTNHGDTETIFLRWSADQSIGAVFTDLVAVDYPARQRLPMISQLINQIHSVVGGELGRVILVKLKPSGMITPHVDEGQYADYYDRFHLPLSTNNEHTLYVEYREGCGEFCHMQVGELWWFNHKLKHYAVNGDTDRIHLIVDIKTDRCR